MWVRTHLKSNLKQQRPRRRIPSLDPQRDNHTHARKIHDAPQWRELAVLLQHNVDGVVRDAAGQVPRAEVVERPIGHASRDGGHDAARVEAERLKSVAGSSLGALDALECLFMGARSVRICWMVFFGFVFP